jgi:hypothetical protein
MARLLTLLLMVACSGAGGAALHKDARLARSGCAVVLQTLAELVANPPPQLAGRTVADASSSRAVPFPQTAAFRELSVKALCGSALLTQYRRQTGLFGWQSWAPDAQADYSPPGSRAADRELLRVCRRLVNLHRDALLASLSTDAPPPADACERLSGHSPAAPLGSGRWVVAEAVRLAHDPLTLLKLAPLIIMAIALPHLLLPVLRGPPAVPEPRGPAMKEDDDHLGEDEPVVGCVPPRPAKEKGRRAAGVHAAPG